MVIRRFQHRLTAFLSWFFCTVDLVVVGAGSTFVVVLRTITALFFKPPVSVFVFSTVSLAGFGVINTVLCNGMATVVDDTNKPIDSSEDVR